MPVGGDRLNKNYLSRGVTQLLLVDTITYRAINITSWQHSSESETPKLIVKSLKFGVIKTLTFFTSSLGDFYILISYRNVSNIDISITKLLLLSAQQVYTIGRVSPPLYDTNVSNFYLLFFSKRLKFYSYCNTYSIFHSSNNNSFCTSQ